MNPVESYSMNQTELDAQPQTSDEGSGGAPYLRPPSAGKAILAVVVVLIVAVVVVIAGVVPRVRARATLAQETNALAAPTVTVKPPTTGKIDPEVVLPGNISAFTDSPIYARTDGYLKKWYFDIGAHVRTGELLATIDTPEVDQQLSQARADLVTAQATAGLAKINATRYQGLLAQNAVTKQDTDTFVTQAASTSSAVQSAMANVQRLEQLQSFEKVYAPFDGVITARNIDTGQLINSGSGTGQQLFRMAAVNVLRVYVNVPQIYSRGAVSGTPATITLPEFPGVSFPGKIVRTTNSIDPSSRTLLVEVDVDNHAGKLVPGAFAQVHMNLNPGVPSLIVPVPALIFRTEGLQVGTVVKGPQGDQAKLVPVTVSDDDGRTVQVISGLDANAQVIQNPPDSLIDGEPVRVIQPQPDAPTGSPAK
jgi:RND family efflux transporter MFP subunit